jgi:hypothetical protein
MQFPAKNDYKYDRNDVVFEESASTKSSNTRGTKYIREMENPELNVP